LLVPASHAPRLSQDIPPRIPQTIGPRVRHVSGFTRKHLFFNNFGTFLAFIGVSFAPLCGIQIADYYVLRRRRISIRGMYCAGPDSPYHYVLGVNPVAVVAMAAGIAAYVYLLNPVTYDSRMPYPLVSASVLSAVLAGAVFWGLTRLFVKPSGQGGYGQ
jgi:NCS1 family nucleobase:cation symporter-1